MGQDVISLAGTWRFRLDPQNVGAHQKWFSERLDDSVVLPGTTDTNHKGVFKDERTTDRLSRVWYWKGAAWYQRDVTIPQAWNGRHITLLLERTKHTTVWVDDTLCGEQDSLSTPLVFDLSAPLTPGGHTLTLRVDNAKLPPVGQSHAFDERTQTNWNGIIGRIQLRATDPAWLDDVQVYPDAASRAATIKIAIGNTSGGPIEGGLEIGGETYNTDKAISFPSQRFPVRIADSGGTLEVTYRLGESAPLWDEFSPALIRLRLGLAVRSSQGAVLRDARTVTFGLRQFATSGGQFLINGRPTFLRGKLDCCIFPLTGHPPMDKAGWLRVLGIAKSYGINHYRFHSWCPPEAAFEAADELGIYIQAELPNKATAFQKPEHGGYLKREAELIFRAFGNHPSFVMFTLGNELGRQPAMFEMVRHFKSIDPRRLYAQGSNNVHWAPTLAEGDDFWVTCKTGRALPVRGSFSHTSSDKGHIENCPPSTMVDFGESIAGIPVPVVAHETGQFQVSPDFREIPQYTGVTRARNLETFRDRLRQAGLLDQAHDFVRASGALAVICYREEIEAALRTPGFGGFQLLDIQDFPGQGTALVGILNAFMEPKGLIRPEQWRLFCGPIVPLLRMTRYTWTTEEQFVGRVQVAHYGPADLAAAEIVWTALDDRRRQIATGTLGPLDIRQGNVRDVGMVRFPLVAVQAPRRLVISLAIRGTTFANDYDVWVYPANVDVSPPAQVRLVRRLEPATVQYLQEGGKALLLPDLKMLDDPAKSVAGSFQCDFWCWPMFKRAAERMKIPVAPGTLGILCDPDAPALAAFPTQFHSNWQWWHLVKNSRPLILDETTPEYRPLVQVIDNFERNHKLGLIFETRVGRGAMLVCAIDLLNHLDKPEVRQLLHSLLKYAASDRFAPKCELETNLLMRLFSEAR